MERESTTLATVEGERFDATRSEVPSGRDHRETARGGGRVRSGEEGSRGLKADRRHEQTYFQRKKEYGSLRIDQAKRLNDLEKENAWLKRLRDAGRLASSPVRETRRCGRERRAGPNRS